MATEEKVSGFFALTSPAILEYPNVIDAKRFKGKNGKEKGDPKFSATVVLDPDGEDWKTAKAIITALAKQHVSSFDGIKFPHKSGDKVLAELKAKFAAAGKEYDGRSDHLAGKIMIAAKSGLDIPPQLGIMGYDPKGNLLVNPDDKTRLVNGILALDDEGLKRKYKSKFYRGVGAFATLKFQWYDAVDDGKPGVTAYLVNVLSTGVGKNLGGARSVTEAFKGYAGKPSGESPSAGMDEDLDDELSL